MCRLGQEHKYMNVKQEDMETQNRREKMLIQLGAKTQKQFSLLQFFLVSVNTLMWAVYTHHAITLSLCTLYMLTNAYTSNNNHHFCHKYLSEWWQEEEEEETPSQRNRGQVELQNRRS